MKHTQAVQLAVAVLFFIAACGDSEQGTGLSGRLVMDEISESPEGHSALEEQFVGIGNRIPGFGGFYFDGHTFVVLLQDTSLASVAEQDLAPILSALRNTWAEQELGVPGPVMEIRPARFSAHQLLTWRNAILASAGNLQDAVYIDYRHSNNRLEIGLAGTARADLLPFLDLVGVPAEAVAVQVGTVIRPAASTILTAHHRPVRGGLQGGWAQPGIYGESCTLGFNAVFSGAVGQYIVMNSHCSQTEFGPDASDAIICQPGTLCESYPIGAEHLDPAPYWTKGCPLGEVCRWSDASLGVYDNSSDSDFGRIAHDGDREGTSVLMNDPDYPYLAITAEEPKAIVEGLILDKIGSVTGWTYGPVNRECVHLNYVNEGFHLMCQHTVADTIFGGDSGAPVIEWISASEAALYGIAHTLTSDINGVDEYIFSPLSGVKRDLGAFVTY